MGDNLSGGGVRLAEVLVAQACDSAELSEVWVYHSGNLKLPRSQKLHAAARRVPPQFVLAHLARSQWARAHGRDAGLMNLTNFPVWSPAGPCRWRRELVLVHQAYLVASPPALFAAKPAMETATDAARRLFFWTSVRLASSRTGFVVQTRWMAEELGRLLPPGRRVVIAAQPGIHTAVEPASGPGGRDPRAADFLPVPYWVYPAAFETHKNHAFLMPLAAKLKERRSPVRLLVTVTGRRGAAFVEAVRTAGLGDVIVNLGWLEAAAVSHYLRHARGLLFLSTLESLGLPLVEALAQGKPIVAADQPVTREICGGHAVYFDLQGPEAASRVAERLDQAAADRPPTGAAPAGGSSVLDSYYLAHLGA